MEIKAILKRTELFNGLSIHELEQITTICKEKSYKPKEVIASNGEYTDELFIITKGLAEVHLGKACGDKNFLVNLGEGQIIGEISLIDQGPRSATVIAGNEPTTVLVIQREDLDTVCQEYPRIGYYIMRNIATDLAFKLRHRNINEGGYYDDL